MFRKLFAPALLSLACLFMVTDFAQAQRRGGGNNWNRGGNSWNRGGYNWNRGGNWNRNDWQWWVNRAINPNYGRGYYGGYYYPRNYYSSPYWYSSTPTYTYPSTSYYYAPSTDYVEPVADSSASIRVIVPDPAARVWFDGAATQQTGVDRYFHTPPLNPNASNSYRIRASWMQNGQEVVQERIVAVSPGASAVVDFR